MDRLHYRQNFLKCSDSKIHYHIIKERPKVSKIAKFGCKFCKMQKIQACKVCKFCILLYYARKTDTTIEKTVSLFHT